MPCSLVQRHSSLKKNNQMLKMFTLIMTRICTVQVLMPCCMFYTCCMKKENNIDGKNTK
jgi:hypothetical protein